jgi:CBS domain-containing protein
MAKSKRPRATAKQSTTAASPAVKELMTTAPRTCSVFDSANDAAHIMWQNDCGAVPVVAEDGRVVGIVTDRDICMGGYFRGVPLSGIPVTSIMSTGVRSCQAGDAVARAEELMREHQVNRLPVLDDAGTLVGMLSLCDVTRGFKRAGEAGQQPDGQGLLTTVVSIREPRVVPAAES